MNLTYDGAMFDFVNSSKGTLTGNWGLGSANSPSPRLIKVGGATFGGTPIAVGSSIRISVFTDDLVGMGVPNARWFTLIK